MNNLNIAYLNSDYTKFLQLLDENPDLLNSNLNNFLYQGTAIGLFDFIKGIIDRGYNKYDNYSAFHKACFSCNLDLMKLFYSPEIDVNKIKDYVLWKRIVDEDTKLKAVQYLLDKGANPDNFMLHSISKNYQKIVQLCVSNGSKILFDGNYNARFTFQEFIMYRKYTLPILYALLPNKNNILLVSIYNNNLEDFNLYLEEYKNTINPEYPENALTLAVDLNRVDMAKTLLEHDCEIINYSYTYPYPNDVNIFNLCKSQEMIDLLHP